MTFLASISTNILRIDPTDLVPPPASHEARRRILAAGDAYQADVARKAAEKAHAAQERTVVEALDTLSAMLALVALQAAHKPAPVRIRRPPAEMPITTPAEEISAIIAQVAERHGFTVDLMKSHRRHASLCFARHEAFYRLYDECSQLSLPMIGRLCGGYDHSSVSYGLRRHAIKHGLPYPVRGKHSET